MTAPGRYAASDGSFAKSAGGAAARGGVLIAIAIVIGFALLQWGFDGGDSDAALPIDVGNDDGGGDDSADDSADDGASDDGSAADDGAAGDDGSAGDDGAGDDGSAGDDGTDDGTGDDGSAGEVLVDPPSEVNVVVLNGSGEGGLAGERASVLGAVGYVVVPGNAASWGTGENTEESKVYFTLEFADEAKEVAEALSGTAAVLEQAPADPGTLAHPDNEADAAAADVIVVIGTDGQLR